ncbi:MAG: hypothetical protein WCM93_13050 [Bacteroidota bacterium]
MTMEASKDLILGEIQQLTGIDAGRLFDIGLLSPDYARKWVVKQKYFQLAKSGRTYTDIKLELSVDFGLSVSTIEKMIYRK